MLHPLPLPLSSCLGCIPPLIGLPSLRFYAVGSSLFLLSVCFCLCSLFYRDDVLCWLLLARPFLYAFHAHLRFPVDLVWFRLSCDHGWIRSGSVNVRKQQQQQQQQLIWRCRVFRVFFVPLPFSLCMESTSYVLSSRLVFFYLVTRGWNFDISLICENLINQSMMAVRTFFRRRESISISPKVEGWYS